MIDWTASMQQTFEYYTVDPKTWKDVKLIDNVKSSSISRDLETETLGSATIDITESLGECYVRIYLVAIQNGVTYKFPLGTFLVQTPSSSFDGKITSVSMDAYTPLIELKENPPPLGYSILKKTKVIVDGVQKDIPTDIMEQAYLLVREHARAPVVPVNSLSKSTLTTEEYNTIKNATDGKLYSDFVANTDDTWITFLSDLIANAKYYFDLDEMGRILFAPKQDTASLQPVWTYDDSDRSILYQDVTIDRDLYDIPNVIEVIYSDGRNNYYAKAVNDDENSPISTVNRGREKIHRITNPDLIGIPSGQEQIQEYANQALRDLSTLEYRISYKHAYCPVRIGDCVRINYKRAGLTDIKAKVISQSIKCEPGCPVDEKAVFTVKLWG